MILFLRPCLIFMLSCLPLLLGACGAWHYSKDDTRPLPLASDYVLAADDVIAITVFGEDELSGDYRVAPSGQIDLPLAGPVHVAGQPMSKVPALVQSAFEKDYLKDPKISISLAEARPFYILGEVNAPGSFSWKPNLTLVNAAAIAGGFTYRAHQNDFEIIRDGQTYHGAELSSPIQPGDVVRVKERVF